MSYRTLEVEIDHGRVLPKGSDVLPEKASDPRPLGLAKGQFIVPDDFNAPLPEEVLQMFEGK